MIVYDVQEELDAACDAFDVPHIKLDPSKAYYISHGEWSDGEYLLGNELFNANEVYEMCESDDPSEEEIAQACCILSDCECGESVEDSDIPTLFFQLR